MVMVKMGKKQPFFQTGCKANLLWLILITASFPILQLALMMYLIFLTSTL